MSSAQKLIADIERFLKRHDMRQTTFGVHVGHRAMLLRLKSGINLTLETADRIRAFMDAYDREHPRCSRKRSAVRRRKSPAAGAAA